MARRRPTQADVARIAGVSRQLVSLVVRGDPHVAPATRARVERALDELSYEPNSAARTLATNRSGQVGILVPDLTNPFHGELTELLVAALADNGFSAIIATGPDAARAGEVAARLPLLGVDACVLASPRLRAEEVEGLGRTLPTVVLTDDLHIPHTTLLRADNRWGLDRATRHLLAQGYDPVVFLSPPPRSAGDSVHLRTRGYRDVVEEAGFPPRVHLVDSSTTAREVAGDILQAHGPGVAFACHDDRTAVSVLMAVADAGLRPGADVGVSGFDNSSLAGLPGVDLTSVDQGLPQMVELCVGAIVRALDTGGSGLCEGETVIRPTLVTRTSSLRTS